MPTREMTSTYVTTTGEPATSFPQLFMYDVSNVTATISDNVTKASATENNLSTVQSPCNATCDVGTLLPAVSDTDCVLAGFGLAVCLLGFVGNIFSTLMMCNSTTRRSAYSVYVTKLSLCDLLSLMLAGHRSMWQVLVYTGVAGVSLAATVLDNPAFCVLRYLEMALQCASMLTVAILGVDQCISLYSPLLRLIWCTRKCGIISMAVTLAFAIVVYLPQGLVAMTHKLEPHLVLVDNIVTPCSYNAGWMEKTEYLHFTVTFALPLLVIAVASVAVSVYLRSRQEKITTIEENEEYRAALMRMRYINRLTVVFLGICISTIILSLPKALYMVIRPSLTLDDGDEWISRALHTVFLVRCACTFYIAMCCQTFRQSLFQLICHQRVNMEADFFASTVKRRAMANTLENFPEGTTRKGGVVGINIVTETNAFQTTPEVSGGHRKNGAEAGKKFYQGVDYVKKARAFRSESNNSASSNTSTEQILKDTANMLWHMKNHGSNMSFYT